MTSLDKSKSSVFFQESLRGPMITASGIDRLFPGSKISDMEFPGCGYSMNGIVGGGSVYTIHVAPEEGFSFASFELCQYQHDDVDLGLLVESVVFCFDPAHFTVAVVGSSKFSGELILKNRVVRCKEIKVRCLGHS
ncbi:S-adenosylmethionine decarboxylase proenzyme 1 [Raphanus sativus]|nr:S-adenosylmethionine decarboxylase proenzyme 1 [Raphanus sativus]